MRTLGIILILPICWVALVEIYGEISWQLDKRKKNWQGKTKEEYEKKHAGTILLISFFILLALIGIYLIFHN